MYGGLTGLAGRRMEAPAGGWPQRRQKVSDGLSRVHSLANQNPPHGDVAPSVLAS